MVGVQTTWKVPDTLAVSTAIVSGGSGGKMGLATAKAEEAQFVTRVAWRKSRGGRDQG